MNAGAITATVDAGSPIVKWAGGKTKLLAELTTRLPNDFERYFEPFAGGAALFFELASQRPDLCAVLNDANAGLIGLYRAVAEDVEDLIGLLDRLQADHDAEHYHRAVESWNSGHGDPVVRAATFLYLNRTCFNGLWRENRSGQFNVPMGDYDRPRICDHGGLRAASTALRRAALACGDYRAVVAGAARGDLVYFDPPYDDTFVAYTADAFGRDDQSALAETAHELVRRGCRVMLSNSDTRFVRELYRGFQIGRVRCPRAINADADGRGDVDELLIVGGYDVKTRRAPAIQPRALRRTP